ncbi:c-type cytochrome [Mucilaginibacter limnophilus]|uniref:C-type cytochrome n=1 Tax=Mucilaginibacter limnophilus TaxID=1932778 RepID=A0A3S2VNB8_9SPHI|nr:c-type cytochrome [Mucilaginibacter limnophilus]RVU01408.1 c-type cytochrome [Mucilaginibacter limnophilus]
MKKILLVPGFMVMLFVTTAVINPAHAQAKKKPAAKAAAGGKASAADIAAGKELISKSDCLACHKIDTKLVGPAYIDVAKKYPATPANYAKLAKKVIDGGAGVWGQIPMSPHASLSMADAKKMVSYILSLK